MPRLSCFRFNYFASTEYTNAIDRDHVGGKPWIDSSSNAQWTFWNAADEWLPTWGEGDSRGMTVRSVKMWQAGKCGAPEEL
jgi:hypothetical protein